MAIDSPYVVIFDSHVEKMRKKQEIHEGARSHPHLRALDNLKRAGLTYYGWQDDVLKAEKFHVDDGLFFNDHLEQMQRKQASHVGDHSHPQLQVLDNLREELTYNGWEEDVQMAIDSPYVVIFDSHVEKMRKKQIIHTSQQNAQRLPAQVSHHPRRQPVQQMARRIDDRKSQLAGTNESKECVICWSSKKTHAFIPCGHMCVCDGCVASIQDHKCPICRMASQQIVKIYQ